MRNTDGNVDGDTVSDANVGDPVALDLAPPAGFQIVLDLTTKTGATSAGPGR